MQLSQKALGIQPSSTLAITSRAKELVAQGRDLVSFGAGEPDFATPEHIVQAACAALNRGETRYTAVSGIAKLREAIAAPLGADPSGVVVSCGAKHSLYNAFQVLLNPGDEVLIPIPYWVSYPQQVALAGGKSVFVSCQEDLLVDFQRLEAALTPKTRGLVLNSPSNPSGAVYSTQQLAAIGEFAERHDLFIISDEIYQALTYDGLQAKSLINLFPELAERTVVIDGVSKKYAMTGWRIGWAVAPQHVAKAMGSLQSHSTSNPTSFAQSGALAALQGPQEPVEMMREEFGARRDLICELADTIPGLSYRRPQGAFYLFVDLSALVGKNYQGKVIEDGDTFAGLLLDEASVAVVPGGGFGMPNHLRLSYAIGREQIKKGLSRIGEFVGKLEG